MELVHEEERVGCKKISVGVYKLQNTRRKVMVIFIKKKYRSAYEKKKINKRMMKDERKRMRKEGRKV